VNARPIRDARSARFVGVHKHRTPPPCWRCRLRPCHRPADLCVRAGTFVVPSSRRRRCSVHAPGRHRQQVAHTGDGRRAAQAAYTSWIGAVLRGLQRSARQGLLQAILGLLSHLQHDVTARLHACLFKTRSRRCSGLSAAALVPSSHPTPQPRTHLPMVQVLAASAIRAAGSTGAARIWHVSGAASDWVLLVCQKDAFCEPRRRGQTTGRKGRPQMADRAVPFHKHKTKRTIHVCVNTAAIHFETVEWLAAL
jgi:hypothetical protein